MKMRFTTILCAAVASVGLASASTQEMREVDYDIGFTIPTEDAVQSMRDNRRSYGLGDRVGRQVMEAFELYEEDEIFEAIEVLEGISTRTAYEEAYVARFLGTMYASLEGDDARPERAIELLQSAVEPDLLGFSDQRAGLQLLANLLLQEERYEEAIEGFRNYMSFTGEWDPAVLTRMAMAYMELENYDMVVPAALKAIKHFEEPNRNPYVLLIATYYETGQIQEAIGILEQGLTAMPHEERWWSQLGMFYMLEEDYETALATMEIAYAADFMERENDFRALVQLYANNGIPYFAADVMVRHIDSGDIEPTHQNLANAARSFHNARAFVNAADAYARAVEADEEGNNRQGYFRRMADAYLMAEEYADAAAAYDNAINELPAGDDDRGQLYMSLAEAYFYGEQYESAYNAAMEATNFSRTRDNAASWAEYIQETAERRGVEF